VGELKGRGAEAGLAAERDRLARTLRETRLQLAMTQSRLAALEQSATMELGRTLVRAARRPWPRGVQLPRDLVRLWRERGGLTGPGAATLALASAQLGDLAGVGERFLSALTAPGLGAPGLGAPGLSLPPATPVTGYGSFPPVKPFKQVTGKEPSALTSRALVYGDINLNLIDGSAIWLQSVTQALARAGCAVTLVLKAPVRTSRLIAPLLAEPGITVRRPFEEHLLDGPGPLGAVPASAAGSSATYGLPSRQAAICSGRPNSVSNAWVFSKPYRAELSRALSLSVHLPREVLRVVADVAAHPVRRSAAAAGAHSG